MYRAMRDIVHSHRPAADRPTTEPALQQAGVHIDIAVAVAVERQRGAAGDWGACAADVAARTITEEA